MHRKHEKVYMLQKLCLPVLCVEDSLYIAVTNVVMMERSYLIYVRYKKINITMEVWRTQNLCCGKLVVCITLRHRSQFPELIMVTLCVCVCVCVCVGGVQGFRSFLSF